MKKLVVLTVSMLMLMGLAACELKKCDTCGDVTMCSEVEFLGETNWMCTSCKAELERLLGSYNGIFDEAVEYK